MAEVLTLRDIQESRRENPDDPHGGLTDELLDPFVEGDSDDEREFSRNAVRNSIRSHLSYLDSVDPETRNARLDEPIVSAREDTDDDVEDDEGAEDEFAEDRGE